MIEHLATEQHRESLRRAALLRQARGTDRRGPIRLRLARRLVSVAGKLDPEATVVALRQPASAATAGAGDVDGARRAA